MTGNQNRNRIGAASTANRTDSFGPGNSLGYLCVGASAAIGDAHQGAPDALLEKRAGRQIQGREIRGALTCHDAGQGFGGNCMPAADGGRRFRIRRLF